MGGNGSQAPPECSPLGLWASPSPPAQELGWREMTSLLTQLKLPPGGGVGDRSLQRGQITRRNHMDLDIMFQLLQIHASYILIL